MKEYKIKINGSEYAVTISDIEENTARVMVNGIEYEAELEGIAPRPKTPKLVRPTAVVSTDYIPSTARTMPPAVTAEAKISGSAIKSPLPGVIVEVLVRVGDKVGVGQKLMTLEAMKMENNIDSDVEGVVKSIVKQSGESVLEGDVLVIFE
ncbi:MAG: biotin/lipoyl-binding protein [Rikenellaceae bacterium]|jgi:biotin carboxyl carrier protein|nr:biotin/lipoyl-binding protein [Rikenellaceae bacterium]